MKYINQVVLGDCRDLAGEIPDQSARLVFVDPPYWVNFDYGDRKDSTIDHIDPKWLVSEGLRIAPIVLITPGYRTEYAYPPPDWKLVWRKGNSMKRYKWGFAHTESILCYGEPKLPMRKMRPDWYDAPIVVETHTHACPKPLSLMRQLIETFTEPGETVVDFCSGSGTTAVACKTLGRNFIGFEVDEISVKESLIRLDQTTPDIFTPPAQTQIGMNL